MTLAVWQRMADYYLQQDRSPTRLASKFGVSVRTGERVVYHGMPSLNKPPLKQIAKEYDERARNQDSPRIEAQLAAEASEFAKVKRANLTAARTVKGLLGLVQNALVRKYQNGIPENAPANETRVILSHARDMARTLKDIGEFEMRWLHGAEPEDVGADDTPMATLTDEQIEQMAETGNLPDGVDADAFLKGLGFLGAPRR